MDRLIQSPMKQRVISARWMTLLFQLLSLSLVLIYQRETLTPRSLGFSGLLIVLTLLSQFLVNLFHQADSYLLMIANMLFSIGVILIYRLSSYYGYRQLIFYTLGIALFFVAYFLLERTAGFWVKKICFYFFGAAALLVLTLLFGFASGGAKNWIEIGGFSFQPSEIAKVPFCFLIAGFYANRERVRKRKGGKYFLMAMTYILIALFFLQRELGTAMVFMAILFSAQVAFEEDKKLIFLNVALAVVGMVAAYYLFGHIRTRVDIWIDPWVDMDGRGYQITQSLFGIAAGGFFGTGLGLGHPQYIPLAYSDFIFSAIAEEMGTFMGIAVIMLYLILVYRGIKISLAQPHPFYKVLALCISISFAAQALIMIGGVLKLIPLTGITLPFMAHGGSSLVTSFVLLGILFYCSNAALEVPREE